MKNYGMPFKNAAIDKLSGKFGNEEPKKNPKVDKMTDFDVRSRATKIKYGDDIMGPSVANMNYNKSWEAKEILRKDLDINRRNTNDTNVNINSQGTKTVVQKVGTDKGYATRVKVTDSAGKTYYKEKVTPYKYK
jgi:hypothetical protein